MIFYRHEVCWYIEITFLYFIILFRYVFSIFVKHIFNIIPKQFLIHFCFHFKLRPTSRGSASNGSHNGGGIQAGIADDQARDFDFEKTEMKYDSTGMFHWSPARSLEDCILVIMSIGNLCCRKSCLCLKIFRTAIKRLWRSSTVTWWCASLPIPIRLWSACAIWSCLSEPPISTTTSSNTSS